MKIFKIIVMTLALLGTTQASANDYDLSGRWGLGLGIGQGSVENSDRYEQLLDGDLSGSLWLRYHLSSSWALEFDFTRLAFEGKAGAQGLSLDASQLNLNIAYRFWSTRRFRVLLQAGVGATELDSSSPGSEKTKDFDIKGKLGLEYMATSNLALALHGDYGYINVGSGTDTELHTITPMLALTYYFGGGAAAPVDTDGDGVTDDKDQCPTQGGDNLDTNGCPKKPEVKDTDGDGVSDDKDQCSGTPAGKEVTEYGCAKEEKLEFSLNVKFASGSTTIDPSFIAELQKFSEFMKKYPEVKAEIAGYTDNTGSKAGNMNISKKRAQAVVSYLDSNLGVEKSRLKAMGYGPADPIADNKTRDGRAKNRRVVAKIMN